MLRVLATDGLEKNAVKALQELGCEVVEQFYEPDALMEQAKAYDVLVVRSATKVREPIIDAARETGRLKLIIRGGVGVDNIDVAYARDNGIEVCNTPEASSVSVAELAIGHMFALSRFIGIANVTMRQGVWEKKAYKGTEITGKTLGLIGIGRIARETGKRAAALGMNVIYTNRSGHKPEYDPYVRYELDDLLKQSDYVSLHTPGPKGTPPAVVVTINREVNAALPALKTQMLNEGAEPLGGTPEQFAAFIKTEYDKWALLVKKFDAPAN